MNVESEVIVGITKLGEIELEISLHSREEFPDETVNVKNSVVCSYIDPKDSLAKTMKLEVKYNKNDI